MCAVFARQASPGMIRHILAKDWRLLWPMVAFVTLIQICLGWVQYAWGYFGGVAAATHVLHPLTIAWFASITALSVAVVQQDAIPALDQDWLIRPLKRRDLLVAKLLFVALAVSVPMCAVDLVRALAAGFPLRASMVAATLKEPYVYIGLVMPVMALAATTVRMGDLMTLGAALVVLYALATGVTATVTGSGTCPTCDSGIAWVQHVLGHLGICLGALAILGLQYFKRATTSSRALAILGVLAVVGFQLPWNAAFAVQRWLSPAPGTAKAITISFDAQAARVAITSASEPASDAALAARALLHGNVAEAGRYVRARARTAAAPLRLETPVLVTGLADDELLYVDGAEFAIIGQTGDRLYHHFDVNVAALVGVPSGSGGAASQALNQTIDIPPATYRDIASQAVRLQVKYSLTLMRVLTRHLLTRKMVSSNRPTLGAARP